MTSQLTHTYNGDSSLIKQPYTRIHALPPPNTQTRQAPTKSSRMQPRALWGQSPHPLTPLLMDQSAGSIHFIAVRAYRSAPFSPVPTEQQGSSEIERSRRGLKHPGSSKTPHVLSALVPQKYGVLMVCSSVYACV